jgi:hypothetical protein
MPYIQVARIAPALRANLKLSEAGQLDRIGLFSASET